MLYIVAIVLPPLAVLLAGRPGAAILNIILTLCLWVPGIIHAWIVIASAHADQRNQRTIAAIEKSTKEQVKATKALADEQRKAAEQAARQQHP